MAMLARFLSNNAIERQAISALRSKKISRAGILIKGPGLKLQAHAQQRLSKRGVGLNES